MTLWSEVKESMRGCPYCFGAIIPIGTPAGTMWKCIDSGFLLACLTGEELEQFNVREAELQDGIHP